MAIEMRGLVPLLQVFDMNESLHFYCDVLGFEVLQRSPEVETPEGRFSHWALLRRGGAELMLNTAYDSGERPMTRDGAREQGHGDTGLFIACPDLDAAWRHLAERGIALPPPAETGYGMRQLHLRDPDGFALCLQWRAGG